MMYVCTAVHVVASELSLSTSPMLKYWHLLGITNIHTILLKPFFCYEASIADNGHTWEFQVFFAVANQLSNKFAFLVNERFPSAKINLLHAFVQRSSKPGSDIMVHVGKANYNITELHHLTAIQLVD